MDLTRGLPYNVTTEMDLVLWETAARHFSPTGHGVPIQAKRILLSLVTDYKSGKQPQTAQNGHRAFSRTLWGARKWRD